MLTLRMNDGFDQESYTALTDALRDLATAWDGLEELPQLAVNVLVDIVPITEGLAHSYPEPVSARSARPPSNFRNSSPNASLSATPTRPSSTPSRPTAPEHQTRRGRTAAPVG